jgi:hypothetical protein
MARAGHLAEEPNIPPIALALAWNAPATGRRGLSVEQAFDGVACRLTVGGGLGASRGATLFVEVGRGEEHGFGEGRPRGTEDEPATRSSAAYVGTVSLASKARPSVPGPGAFLAPPGPLI